MKDTENNIRSNAWGGFKPFKVIIHEIFFSYKIYFYVGFATIIIPLIIFPFLYLWLINTEFLRSTNIVFLGIDTNLFKVIITTFFIISTLTISLYWIFLLIRDPPIVKGVIHMTLVELLVFIHGRVYLQLKWKDIDNIQLNKTKILTKGLHMKGYRLGFYGLKAYHVLKLWSFLISKKKLKHFFQKIREISRVNHINMIEHSFIEEIEPIKAHEEFEKIRHFKKGLS